ncbi:unnamed protein product [Tuber melanosporum]|uniref:(Perigord truffle) hypothetical protein n=1 Tax=Tuber melanosporum (strain Mel28) TaxID=656061 RepID=D5GAN7_TUBMM|nr:unnamed protein product [Tuber melanosporum]
MHWLHSKGGSPLQYKNQE